MNCVPRSDTFVVDLDKKVNGGSRAKATLSKRFAQAGDENTFQEAFAQWAPLNRKYKNREGKIVKEMTDCVRG